ncbi:MAG: aspartate--tRNA ligase [Oscillospiraceae bacterium]|nr:aspartate--tRNA ligase [Oscillospiraceae bacterium]
MNEQYRTHTCGELREEHIGQTAKLSGWVATIRSHGGVIFVDLRDHYGLTQLVLHDESLLKGVTRETVICAEGVVVKRDEETVNPKLATGMVELHAGSLTVLSAPPAFLPIEVGNSDSVREEMRLKYRYLDLRGPRMQHNLKFRAAFIRALRENMEKLGFLEVHTPILTASSPEGARDYLVPSRKFKGKFYALPQAPQMFKQMLMLSGIDRYYQIAPCFRDEDARYDRSPGEFYQLDFEMAFATQEDVMEVTETVLFNVFTQFASEDITYISKPPFRRIPYREAMLRYGSDKPDLRNPLLIEDLSEFFADVEFKPFRGRPVRGINAPGGALQPRAFFEQMLKFAESIGMQGLGYISRKPDPVNSAWMFAGPIGKYLSEEKKFELVDIFDMQVDDTVFFICDRPGMCDKLAGQIRTELGNRLGLVDKTRFEFCYITDMPMFEIDENTKKLGFSHNPFSMPQGGMEALMTQAPLDILAYQYDIVLNGVELSSGAVRNHVPEIMVKAFEIAGYSEEDLKARFGAMYTAFQHGAPPHAGMAPGVERMVMLLLGEANIREVTAFPLNGSAQDTMMGAPGGVSEQQLRDVHIRVR